MSLCHDASRPKLVLASGSPRRRELLDSLALDFTVRPPDVEEVRHRCESPGDYVRRLARAKATAIGADGELVIAADTVVVVDGEILEKPTDPPDAATMLERLSGRDHQVLTGVSLWEVSRDAVVTEAEESRVLFRALSREEIDWYVGTGEPSDKAGGYALQGIGAIFVAGVEGSSSNVIGLPLGLVYDLFTRLGHDLKRFSGPVRGGRPVDTLRRR